MNFTAGSSQEATSWVERLRDAIYEFTRRKQVCSSYVWLSLISVDLQLLVTIDMHYSQGYLSILNHTYHTHMNVGILYYFVLY